ncbi:TetR family transcriptional regulator [Caballeronia mineralivorans PML1(12)]|uniref:TetR family transcriptional regulator n=1 Tax=Caballeronia mineralivorans PML1(12) TaxID=908627 RepID=A0A0J1CJZ1_9BURK|nr:TetR/AcrR family transcriptional regulator [Caballeronia mineralivorans]KLU21030.1 TetR family transcriptional regulator [Caballeronia mineralivorans PML1(12)]
MTVSTARPAQAAKEKRSRGRPACSAIAGSDALLKSARQAFAKRGFDATSVREIARDCGVDPALISHHFGSKEALWIAVVEQIAEQTAPMIESTAKLRSSDFSPRKRVERALAIFIDKVFSEPDIGMFFSTAATEQGERLDVLVERLLRPYHDAFVVLLADAMDAGELTRNDPEVLFAMLTNAVGKTVSYSHVLSIFSSLPQHEAKFKRTVLAAALSML